MHRRFARLLCLLTLVALPAAIGHASGASAASQPEAESAHPLWAWPVEGAREVLAAYRAPANEYGAGHRGVDLAPGTGVVRAPDDGVVAFRGTVVDRPLLTIEHPGGYVSTFEPLLSDLSVGDLVSAGDEIGTVAHGGHAAAGALHVGVRLDGLYMNPLLMFGQVPRAVLLPCCAPL